MSYYGDDDYWRYRYQQIDRDHAETMRGYRESIERSQHEIRRLDGELAEAERSRQLKQLLDEFESKQKQLAASIEQALSISSSVKDEWLRDASALMLIGANTDEGFGPLRSKIAAYKRRDEKPSEELLNRDEFLLGLPAPPFYRTPPNPPPRVGGFDSEFWQSWRPRPQLNKTQQKKTPSFESGFWQTIYAPQKEKANKEIELIESSLEALQSVRGRYVRL